MTTPSASAVTPVISQGDWWRTACIYEIYPRSFCDGSGDGVGDIPGMIAKLPYLRWLGVDAVWVTPWFVSPMADGGYDVSDYRQIAPVLGSLADASSFLDEAHRHGLRVLLDLVPNHSSVEHPWFHEACRRGPHSAAANRYWIKPGRGPDGQLPPNDWRSVFGGSAWSPFPTPDGRARRVVDGVGFWYLHLFAPEQPDLNWTAPEVADEFDAILRFWFDRGVDGFRIDVAHGLSKDPALPEIDGQGAAGGAGLDPSEVSGGWAVDHPHWDRDDNDQIFRRWRDLADSYAETELGPRVFVAEAWRIRPHGLSRYLQPGSLHTAFNLDLLAATWNAEDFRLRIRSHLEDLDAVGAPATWVLGSHDIVRVASRLSRASTWSEQRIHRPGEPSDAPRGLRRARAAALLVLALPGGCYIYQGEELGLPEVEDLPEDLLADPMWKRSGHTVRGRDGCRVPLPWAAEQPHLGFSRSESWLPQPEEWTHIAADRQRDDPTSTLQLYRQALTLRAALLQTAPPPPLDWAEDKATVIGFDRGSEFRCVVNFADQPVAIPRGFRALLHSTPTDLPGWVPGESAAWLTPESAPLPPPMGAGGAA